MSCSVSGFMGGLLVVAGRNLGVLGFGVPGQVRQPRRTGPVDFRKAVHLAPPPRPPAATPRGQHPQCVGAGHQFRAVGGAPSGRTGGGGGTSTPSSVRPVSRAARAVVAPAAQKGQDAGLRRGWPVRRARGVAGLALAVQTAASPAGRACPRAVSLTGSAVSSPYRSRSAGCVPAHRRPGSASGAAAGAPGRCARPASPPAGWNSSSTSRPRSCPGVVPHSAAIAGLASSDAPYTSHTATGIGTRSKRSRARLRQIDGLLPGHGPSPTRSPATPGRCPRKSRAHLLPHYRIM